jgi:ankyrin repeat protein
MHRFKTVKALLKNGALRNIADGKGRTPLHYVAFKYREDPSDSPVSVDIVNALCGASPVDDDDSAIVFVNRADKAGQTALHLAAQYGQQKTIKALIDCKASVSESLDFKGYTPIMTAAFSKEAIQVLHGSD